MAANYQQFFATVDINTGRFVDPDNNYQPIRRNKIPIFTHGGRSVLCLSFVEDKDGTAYAFNADDTFEFFLDNDLSHALYEGTTSTTIAASATITSIVITFSATPTLYDASGIILRNGDGEQERFAYTAVSGSGVGPYTFTVNKVAEYSYDSGDYAAAEDEPMIIGDNDDINQTDDWDDAALASGKVAVRCDSTRRAFRTKIDANADSAGLLSVRLQLNKFLSGATVSTPILYDIATARKAVGLDEQSADMTGPVWTLPDARYLLKFGVAASTPTVPDATTQVVTGTAGDAQQMMTLDVLTDGIFDILTATTATIADADFLLFADTNDSSDYKITSFANFKTALSYQPLDAELTAIAGLTSAANKIPYFTGSETAGLLDFLDENDMASDSATACASQQSIKAYITTQQALDLKIAQNLADLNNAATARTNLGLGTAAVENTGTASGDVVVRSALKTIQTDTILEITGGSGVTIDSVLIKDQDLKNLDTLIFSDNSVKTISTGTLTINKTFASVAVESGATDDVDTITGPSIDDGMMIAIRPDNPAEAVVLKHNTGNIFTNSAADYTLPNYVYTILFYDATNTKWYLTINDSAATGDMLKATYDTEDNGTISTAAGGTNMDSSSSTGVYNVNSGTHTVEQYNWMDLSIPAGCWTVEDSNTDVEEDEIVETTTNITYPVLAFFGTDDGSGDGAAFYHFTAPEEFVTDSTFRCRAHWRPETGASASDDVRFQVSIGSTANDDAIDTALGTPVTMDDTVTAAGDHQVVTSGQITAAGNPAKQNEIWIKFERIYDHGGTPMTEKAYVLDVGIQFKVHNVVNTEWS